MDNGKKNTLKVLTTNDIRKHARDWTLAGDVGLLAHLEQFSERIINKTQETQTNFNELVDNYEELYTKVGNITNQFLALQNCQFVENRVYDEETPTEEKTEVKVQDEAEQEKLLLMQYKEAVEVGIKLLDTHFQEVQLPPNSDSDEEDEVSPGNSVIWKPKNPYASKKFPFLIGSADWWADDHVGLRPNEDTLDREKIISESESDMESLKSIEKTMKSSSSSSMENIKSIPVKPAFVESSEDLFGFEIPKNNTSGDLSKGSNSVPEESANFLPDFDGETEPEVKKSGDSLGEPQVNEKSSQDEIATSKPKKVDNDFTRELMAKLVSVTNKTGTQKEVQKSEEILPPVESKREESLFDETDDSNDLFSSKVNKLTEKSDRKRDLFFDGENDDELFKGENDLFSGSNLFESDVYKKPEGQPPDKNHFVSCSLSMSTLEMDETSPKVSDSRTETKSSEKKEVIPVKKNLVKDLFDDLDDDDTLFAAKPTNHKPTNKSMESVENDRFKKVNPTAGLGWDNDEGLFDSINTEVDDDFFNSSGLFDDKISKTPKNKTTVPSKDAEVIKTENDKKETSIFDSNISGKESSDDPFRFSSSNASGYKKISILDSEEEDDLFSKSFLEEKKPQVKGLPEAEDDDAAAAALFADKPKPPDSVSVSSSRSSLFDDASASKSRLASVFERDKSVKVEDGLGNGTGGSLFAGDAKLFSGKGREEGNSLFDDCDDGDDLFGAKPVLKSSGDRIEKKETQAVDDLEDVDLFKSSPTKLRSTKSDIFKRSEQKLFGEDPSDTDLFFEKPTKPKPPSSLSLKPGETEKKGQVVGKLNIPDNLKVRFESVAKNIAPGGGKPPLEEKKGEEKEEEVLDEQIQPSTLLKCPSKDRVKIPGRRRPQSRRARQEAIRNSGAWDKPLSEPPKDTLPSPVPSNPLSPSTDEEDFFKVPELDTNFEKEDQSIFKSDLFESSKTSKVDDNLLFDGAPVLSPLSPRKSEEARKPDEPLFKPKVASIFDDDDDLNGEDDDESLFKSSKPEALLQTPKKSVEKSKKPLFDPDTDDEEDDLFGGTSHATPFKLPPVEKVKEGGETKEKENSTFVDPLGLMTKND